MSVNDVIKRNSRSKWMKWWKKLKIYCCNSWTKWKQNNSTRRCRKSPFETFPKQWEINLNNPRDKCLILKSPSTFSLDPELQHVWHPTLWAGERNERTCFSIYLPTLFLNSRRFLCKINFSVRIEILA